MKSEETDKENIYFLLFTFLSHNFDLICIFICLYTQSILSNERRYYFYILAFYIDVPRISHERDFYLIYLVEYDRPSWKFTLGEIRFFQIEFDQITQ